jgi:hypothetical protein
MKRSDDVARTWVSLVGLIGWTRQYYFDAKVSDAGAVPSVASGMSGRGWAQDLSPAMSSEVIRRQRPQQLRARPHPSRLEDLRADFTRSSDQCITHQGLLTSLKDFQTWLVSNVNQ